MSKDLVKRLREVKDWWREPGRTAEQAADRIEELEKRNKEREAALRQICDGPRDADKSYAELFAEVCWEARAALGEKKDD